MTQTTARPHAPHRSSSARTAGAPAPASAAAPTSTSAPATRARPRSPLAAWDSPVTSYALLLAATVVLLLIGLAVVLSSSSIASIRSGSGSAYTGFIVQLIALVVGLIAMGVGSRMPVPLWKNVGPIILVASLALLGVVMLVGTAVGGNKSWIRVGGFSLQPSEVAKLGLALFLAAVLVNRRDQLSTVKGLMLPAGAMAIVTVGMVLLGHDMGTAIILVAIAITAFFVAGVHGRFFIWAGIGLGAAALVLINMGTTRVTRILQWASGDCTVDDCFQQVHGTWALASGGIWGLGPGMSREKWGYLPAADNDYIFAIIGEEFGLVGTLLVLAAYAMILIAVTRIVSRSTNRFAQIAAAGIGAWIVVQACVNIAVVLELLPVTGVPLPLVSSGGSSLIMSLAGIGALMAFARNEPGAQDAFRARPSVVRRSVSVLSKGRKARG